MSLSDPIGDMIARIKNASLRNYKKVDIPLSKFKTKIADVLKNEGYIIDYKVETIDGKNNLLIDMFLKPQSHDLEIDFVWETTPNHLMSNWSKN